MKKPMMTALLDLIFILIFNMMFFVLGGRDHETSTWIAYGFVHFAYLMVIATPLLTRKSKSAVAFGMPISTVSTIYFFVEFFVGLLFILADSSDYKASMLVQVTIAGVYLAALLVCMIYNERTGESAERHQAEVYYLKTVSSELKGLIGRSAEPMANKEIEKAYDVVHASPAKTSPAVAELEKRIYNATLELREAVITRNNAAQAVIIAQNIVQMTEERNRFLKFN